jgi:hypothetical protein
VRQQGPQLLGLRRVEGHLAGVRAGRATAEHHQPDGVAAIDHIADGLVVAAQGPGDLGRPLAPRTRQTDLAATEDTGIGRAQAVRQGLLLVVRGPSHQARRCRPPRGYGYIFDGDEAELSTVTDALGRETRYCLDVAYSGQAIPTNGRRRNLSRVIGPAPTAGGQPLVTRLRYAGESDPNYVRPANVVQVVPPKGVAPAQPGTAAVTCETNLSVGLNLSYATDAIWSGDNSKLVELRRSSTDPERAGLQTALPWVSGCTAPMGDRGSGPLRWPDGLRGTHGQRRRRRSQSLPAAVLPAPDQKENDPFRSVQKGSVPKRGLAFLRI